MPILKLKVYIKVACVKITGRKCTSLSDVHYEALQWKIQQGD